jgi:AbrB family looped-hinge helix DNA binding protein
MTATTRVIPSVIPFCYDYKMAQKVGPKGQVVIPKKFRDELGIEPGDEVVVSLSENGVLIQSVHTTKSLRGMFAGSGMLKMLMDDRRNEAR